MGLEESGGVKAVREFLEDMLSCSTRVFKQPTLYADGNTFEAAAVNRWLRCKPLSPLTCKNVGDHPRLNHAPLTQLIAGLRTDGWLHAAEA